MKKIIYLLLVFIIVAFSFCTKGKKDINYTQPFENKVVTFKDGKIIELDEESLLMEWEVKVQLEQGYPVNFVSTKLKKQRNGELILIAVSDDGNVKMAMLVEEMSDGSIKSAGGGSSCTCSGCTKGCDPKHISGDSWECTDCDSNTIGTCTKSVTATTDPT